MGRWQKRLWQWAALASLAISGVCAQAAVVAGWGAPGGTTAQVGSTIRVQFAVSGLSAEIASSLGLFDIDVLYSSSSLRFLSGTFEVAGPGSNPLALTEPGAPSFLGDFVDLGGTIDVFALSGNSQAVLDAQQSNDLVLFELAFEALIIDPGAFVGIDLNDPFLLFGSSDPFVTLSPQFDPARLALAVVEQGGNQVPEPPTVLLVALASLALCAVRRSAREQMEALSCT